MKHKEKKKKGFKDYLRLLILVVCLCTFIYSGYQLISIYLEYEGIDSKHNELRKQVTLEKPETGFKEIDWDALKKQNPDVVAWIQVPNSKIDYPILDGDDNDKYLYHDISLKYSKEGSLFVEKNHEKPFEEPNTVIYGHNMKNDSMFGDLPEYMKEGYPEEHPFVYVYLPDGTVSRYKVISIHNVDARGEIYHMPIPSLDDYYQYVEKGNHLSNDFPKDNTPMITLSTCASGDLSDMNRIVVHAVLEESGINPNTQKMQ